MPLETATYISDLVQTNPTGSDPKNLGDDHLRLLKSVMKASFPAISGAVIASHSELNLLAGKTDVATQQQIDDAAFSAALPLQTGNAGKVVTTNGTAASWSSIKTVGGNALLGSGDIPMPAKLLATLTPAAAANLDALSVFTTDYDSYLILGTGVIPAANDTLAFRLANSGVVDAAANYYTFPVYSVGSSTPVTSGLVESGLVAPSKGISFLMRVINANDATAVKSVSTDSAYQANTLVAYNSEDYRTVYIGGALSGFRLFWSGGANFQTAGHVRIYGISN